MLEGVNGVSRLVAIAAVILCIAAPAGADIADWNISPLSLDMGDWTASLGGEAGAALYSAHQAGGIDGAGITAAASLDAKLERMLDNGWTIGARSVVEPYHDRLSGDNYGDHFFQKVYGFAQTQYGRVELGQQDGAAYKMAETGPLVVGPPAIDDSNVGFFKDPTTGENFLSFFSVRTGVFASQNFAKISYYSPRLFGIQIGGSYTPHEARDVLPFVSAGPHGANRSDNIFEGAANYEGHFGALTLGAYGGMALAHNAERLPGYTDLVDWAFGGEADYDLGDATLALGGAYHQSNGYGFDTDQAFSRGNTHAVHLSSTLTKGSWIFGLEYSDGIAGAEAAQPRFDAGGYEAEVGYVVNTNLQVTAGYQHLDNSRSSGVFYNAQRDAQMNAEFLYFYFHV